MSGGEGWGGVGRDLRNEQDMRANGVLTTMGGLDSIMLLPPDSLDAVGFDWVLMILFRLCCDGFHRILRGVDC